MPLPQENEVSEVGPGTLLDAQWLRIHLPMQGMWDQSLVRKLRSHMSQLKILQAATKIEDSPCCTQGQAQPDTYRLPLGRRPPASTGDRRHSGSIPGSGSFLGGGHSNPLQYSCLENPYGQRSLAGYSPKGRKQLDTTEHTHGISKD